MPSEAVSMGGVSVSAGSHTLLPLVTHSVLGLALERKPLDRPVPQKWKWMPQVWHRVLMGLGSFPLHEAALWADLTQADSKVGGCVCHPLSIVNEVTLSSDVSSLSHRTGE